MISWTHTLLLFLLFFTASVSSVTAQDGQKHDAEVSDAEGFILALNMDSALWVLDQINVAEQQDYLNSLRAIAGSDNDSFEDYFAMFSSLRTGKKARLKAFWYLFDQRTEDAQLDEFSSDYAELRFFQVTHLRNEGDLKRATELNEELEAYGLQFDQQDPKVFRVNCLILLHDLVLNAIQRNLDESIKLRSKLYHLTDSLGDQVLKIGALHYGANIEYIQQDLEGYIAQSTEAYKLEHQGAKRSRFYLGVMSQLINALAFKGDDPDRVEALLKELFEYPGGKSQSLSLYMQYISGLPAESPRRQSIYELFAVENMLELAEKMERLGEESLNPNEQINLYNELANAFKAQGDNELAFKYLKKTLAITKYTYSQDLSQSLADFQTRSAMREKEAEIDREKAQTRLYTIVAIMAGLLLIISLIAFVRQRRQSLALTAKNKEIEERDAEKALLLKEIHHRVKNNFQIVSSLLEMQIKNIDDAQAREVAEEGQNRVKSMALIHQRLYQNDELVIQFKEYVEKLVHELADMYGSEKKAEVELRVPELTFDIDTAIPLGLILNELVTNAFKYGFDEQSQKLEVLLEQENEGTYRLEVRDNGKGLDPAIDVSKAKSLGLRLVRRLSKQLEGSFSYSSSHGSAFTVHFKDTAHRAMLD